MAGSRFKNIIGKKENFSQIFGNLDPQTSKLGHLRSISGLNVTSVFAPNKQVSLEEKTEVLFIFKVLVKFI